MLHLLSSCFASSKILPMTLALVLVFVLGYIAIAAEHSLRIDKAATAIITGTLCWVILVLGWQQVPTHLIDAFTEFSAADKDATLSTFWDHRLLHHLQEIAGILLFLMGAMTIVEIVDAHEGFRVITDRITAKKKITLLWIIAIITFFLSAALDNLTTAIVMISLVRKLINDQPTRWMFAGVIVIAANAGGAWSPIGDVTTTMLWIGKQITAANIVKELFFVSLVSIIVPLVILSFSLKGEVEGPVETSHGGSPASARERNVAFFLGIGGLLFVPVFKTVTHLPPFMGIMFSLGILWVCTEIMHVKKLDEEKARFTALHALRKIDMPSVLFFLGILLAVAALQEAGQLLALADVLREKIHNVYGINVAIGLLSAVIDNVPLVAASMGMYPIADAGVTDAWAMHFVQDGTFWEFLAYCAGTGGSILIIGSAAGVAVMGLEKIPFTWYLRRISLLALAGYLAGAGVYMLLY